LDYVIIITAQLKTRLSRAMSRRTLSRDEILKRIDLQWSEEEKTGMADFIVYNETTEKDLNNNIMAIFQKLV